MSRFSSFVGLGMLAVTLGCSVNITVKRDHTVPSPPEIKKVWEAPKAAEPQGPKLNDPSICMEYNEDDPKVCNKVT